MTKFNTLQSVDGQQQGACCQQVVGSLQAGTVMSTSLSVLEHVCMLQRCASCMLHQASVQTCLVCLLGGFHQCQALCSQGHCHLSRDAVTCVKSRPAPSSCLLPHLCLLTIRMRLSSAAPCSAPCSVPCFETKLATGGPVQAQPLPVPAGLPGAHPQEAPGLCGSKVQRRQWPTTRL